jgi:hypothetical protein
LCRVVVVFHLFFGLLLMIAYVWHKPVISNINSVAFKFQTLSSKSLRRESIAMFIPS